MLNYPMTRQTIIFRADAGVELGTGHVMRCFALAQELIRQGIRVVLVTAGDFPEIEPRLKSTGLELSHIVTEPGSPDDAQQTCSFASSVSARWIITDGYRFGKAYQKFVKDAGFLLLVIDDFGHAEHYHADIILNQYPYASEDIYKQRDKETLLLLGTRYALLRKEFLLSREAERKIPETAQKILVTLGGSDPDNHTGRFIGALKHLAAESVEIKVVIGGCNPHFSDLEIMQNDAKRNNIQLLRNVTNMSALYSWADLAIASGGSTTLELACLGVPMLTVVIADNQVPVCESLEKAGAAINLGRMNEREYARLPVLLANVIRSKEIRRRLSRNAEKMVDGRGSERVSVLLQEDLLHMRQVRTEDCWMIYGWANDPYVRKISFRTSPISREEHENWFFSQIKNPQVLYLIAENRDNTPVGQVRFDIINGDATASITIAPEFRGLNYGIRILQISTGILLKQTRVQCIHAYVKKGNTISCKAFKQAGYTYEGLCTRDSQTAHHLMYKRGAA
jgi:UDP-2,4-diacetamido-2,4,6-trideoxy-beta-L-altropyranose hydrolase